MSGGFFFASMQRELWLQVQTGKMFFLTIVFTLNIYHVIGWLVLRHDSNYLRIEVHGVNGRLSGILIINSNVKSMLMFCCCCCCCYWPYCYWPYCYCYCWCWCWNPLPTNKSKIIVIIPTALLKSEPNFLFIKHEVDKTLDYLQAKTLNLSHARPVIYLTTTF